MVRPRRGALTPNSSHCPVGSHRHFTGGRFDAVSPRLGRARRPSRSRKRSSRPEPGRPGRRRSTRLASCWPCGCGSTVSCWYPLLMGSEDRVGVAVWVERGGRVRSAWCERRGPAGVGGRLWGVIHGRVGEPEPAWPVADLLGDSQTDEPAGALAMVPEDLSMMRLIRVAVNDSSGWPGGGQ